MPQVFKIGHYDASTGIYTGPDGSQAYVGPDGPAC